MECEAAGHGPRFAVILGKRGRVKGLMLHDDWGSYRLMALQEYGEIADRLRMTGVYFGGAVEEDIVNCHGEMGKIGEPPAHAPSGGHGCHARPEDHHRPGPGACLRRVGRSGCGRIDVNSFSFRPQPQTRHSRPLLQGAGELTTIPPHQSRRVW